MGIFRHRGERQDNPHSGPAQGRRLPFGKKPYQEAYGYYNDANKFRAGGPLQASQAARHLGADAPNMGWSGHSVLSGVRSKGGPYENPAGGISPASVNSLSRPYKGWVEDKMARATAQQAAGDHEGYAETMTSMGNVLRGVNASRLARIPPPPPRPQ